MKKILFIAALFISTGVISSCTKESEVTPTASLSKKVADTGEEGGDGVIDATGKLGTADGGIDRPVKKPN